jgi:hypothetical protein
MESVMMLDAWLCMDAMLCNVVFDVPRIGSASFLLLFLSDRIRNQDFKLRRLVGKSQNIIVREKLAEVSKGFGF